MNDISCYGKRITYNDVYEQFLRKEPSAGQYIVMFLI